MTRDPRVCPVGHRVPAIASSTSSVGPAVIGAVLLAAGLHAVVERRGPRHPRPARRVRTHRHGRDRLRGGDRAGLPGSVAGELAVPHRLGRAARRLQPAADALLPPRRLRSGLPAGARDLALAGGDRGGRLRRRAAARDPAARGAGHLGRAGHPRVRRRRPDPSRAPGDRGRTADRSDDRDVHDARRAGRPERRNRGWIRRLVVPSAGSGHCRWGRWRPGAGCCGSRPDRICRPVWPAACSPWPPTGWCCGRRPVARWPRSLRCGRPASSSVPWSAPCCSGSRSDVGGSPRPFSSPVASSSSPCDHRTTGGRRAAAPSRQAATSSGDHRIGPGRPPGAAFGPASAHP